MKLFKNHSRVLAMLVALVMCLGLAQPAFAADECDHNWVRTKCLAAFCDTAHNDEYTCSKCTATETRSWQTHAHDFYYVNAVNSELVHDGGHTERCYNCTHIAVQSHSYSAATCTKVETCTACDDTRGTTNPDNHVNTGLRNDSEATCGTDGYTGDTYCKDCGETLSTGTKIDATGEHSWTTWTLGDDGKEHSNCDVCGKPAERDVTTTPVDPETCNHVVNTWKNRATENDHVGTCTICKTEVSAKHSFGSWVKVEGEEKWESTCTATGCGAKKFADKEPGSSVTPCEHTYTEWEALGTGHKRICTKCGDIQEELHNSNETIPAVSATCTTPGMSEGKKCSVCGKVTDEPTQTAEKLPHNMVRLGTGKHEDATCEKAASHEWWCSLCHGENEMRSEGEALGHKPGEGATCTENQVCTVCKKTLETKGGHVPEATAAVAATCTETGLTAGERCTVCGETINGRDIIPVNQDHDYSIHMIAGNANVHLLVCSRSDAHDMYQTHNYGAWNGNTRTCATCGYVDGESGDTGDNGGDTGNGDGIINDGNDASNPGDNSTFVPSVPGTGSNANDNANTNNGDDANTNPDANPDEGEDIADNDTPLDATAPVTDTEGEDISDNETPLSGAPTADADVNAGGEADDSSAVSAGEGIGDNDVPMADVPKTSDLSVVWYAATAISALGLTVLGRKKEENDD